MAYNPYRFIDPASQQTLGRGGAGTSRGGITWMGAAPRPGGSGMAAGGSGAMSVGVANPQQWNPRMMPQMPLGASMRFRPAAGGGRSAPMSGGFSMGRQQERQPIVARPSARNSAEYYAQRDALTGNPLDIIERGNRDMAEVSSNMMLRNIMERTRGAGTSAAPISGASTYNANTGQWEVNQGISQPQTIQDIEAGRVAARAVEEDQARLMADADRLNRANRVMGAINRARAAGGSASVSDSGDVPKTIGGLPRDLYWQREANRGMASNVAPLPGYQGVPYRPTAAGQSYLDRLTGIYRNR